MQTHDRTEKSRVEDVMATDVAVVRADQDVHELEKLLLSEKIHGVPVVDSDDRLVGVVSQTDLLAWHYSTGVDGAAFYEGPEPLMVVGGVEWRTRVGDIRAARVEEIMSPVIHCICPDQSIALAGARMLTRKVHRLLVLDDEGRVLGLISAVDLLQFLPGLADVMGAAREELEDGISPPRDVRRACN